MRAAAPTLDVITLDGDDAVTDRNLARITIAFFSGDAWPDRAAPFMSACLHAPALQWMHTASAGVDSPVFGRLSSRDIRLTTSSGASALPIAHTAIMMILGLSRDITGRFRDQHAHRWERRMSDDLDGANLAIIGMGPIGTETAKLAQALGMNPIGCRRTVTGNEPCETRTFAALPELLAWADYVVLALPLTSDTHGLLGAEQLAVMKPTARLINVGRGDLVDEPALIDALAGGRLAGAGLDVFSVEPLPAESPLWDMPNVIVTAHDSGATAGSNNRAATIFAENLGRYSRGEPLLNEVGTDVGAASMTR